MSIARRIKNNRSNSNFGSFGSIEPVASTTDGINIPTIGIMAVTYSYDGKAPTPLWDGKKWLQSNFPARQAEDCTFNIMTQGTGKALVFATFKDNTGKMQYLFVRRVSKGDHTITVKIPFRALPDFRFGIGKKADARIGTNHLTDKEIIGLTNNMLLISETKDAFVTGPLGFAGLGAVQRFTDSYQGIKSSDPSYAKAATGNKLKTASGANALWNGKLADHRWAKHGYTGKKEGGVSRSKTKEGSVEGPLYVCDETGYYAHRTSTYLMRYDPNGNQLGYDAMEAIYDANGFRRDPITALPAGVPIAMVGQFFVHDPPGTADFLAGIGGLGDKRKKYRVSVPHSHWVEKKAKSAYKATAKATVKTLETVGDATLDTVEAAGNFIDDPSLESLVSIVTAPLGMNTCWHYADKVTMSANNIYFIPKNMLAYGSDAPSGERLPTTYASTSAIPYSLNPSYKINEKFDKLIPTTGGKTVTSKVNKRDYAARVEWYNPKTKRWSKPSPHPPFSPKTDKEGKFMIILRFPRQLDPLVDKAEIQAGMKEGQGNYGWDQSAIKSAYPRMTYTKEGRVEKGYNLLGRMEMKDSDTEMRRVFTQKLGNQSFQGKMFLDYTLMIKPPRHGRTYSEKAASFMNTDSFVVRIADPAKFAYLANPEVDYATYIDGELKPGSVVLVMGKALGSINGSNCILTTEGWPSGPLSAEGLAALGTKKPDGYTPRYVQDKVLKPNNQDPRKIVDGSAAGTSNVDFLEFMGHITADDLIDDKMVSGEQVLIDTWKRCFNLDLNADWFKQKAATGDKLEGTDPNNPLHYIVKGDKGESYSFPFSIAWFKIPQYWVGPYLDYNEEGGLQEIEGRPYAISTADKMLYIIQATYTGHVLQTKLNIVTETTEQKELLDAGYPLGPAMNQMNFDPTDVTETVTVDAREREFFQRTGRTHPRDKEPKKHNYTNDPLKAMFYNWDNARVKKADPTPTIAGFSNGSDFYVEDVTEKWGASLAGGPNPYIETIDTMLVPVDQSNSLGDPFLSFGAFGTVASDITDAADNLKDSVDDELEWVKFVANAGKAAGLATGNAVVGITTSISDSDLGTAEKITVIGVATTAAIALGLGAIYFGPAGLAKAPGALYRGFKG